MDQKNSKRKNKQREEDLEDELNEEDEDKMEIEPIEITKKWNKNEMKNENNEDDEWQDDEGNMNVEFIFLDPNENQFSSVKLLINGYLDGMSFRSSELTNLIVQQAQIGTMVGSEDDDEDEPEYKKKFKEQNVFGLVTLLNIGNYLANPAIKEIVSFLLQKSKLHNKPENHQKLLDLLNNNPKKLGLLMNERILNLAPQVVPVLHNQLLEDINWLKTEDKQEYENFNFEYLIVFTKVYKELNQNNTKKVKQSGMFQLNDLIYSKFEDFLFVQKSEFYFAFEAFSAKSQSGVTAQTEKDYLENEICYRMIYLIKPENYYKVIPQLSSQLE